MKFFICMKNTMYYFYELASYYYCLLTFLVNLLEDRGKLLPFHYMRDSL